jgi:excisionase family DNA binding protein
MEESKMTQTRTKARKKPKPSAQANGKAEPAVEVFTLSEAAAYLRVTEAELMRLVDDQALPCRRFGKEWRFLKSAIQDWLRTPPKPGSREAVLSTIGAWKDDPDVEEEIKEIYRKRREDLVEDIQ